MMIRLLLFILAQSLFATTTNASASEEWKFIGKAGISMATGFVGFEARKNQYSLNFGFWGFALSAGGKYYFQSFDMPMIVTAVYADGTWPAFDSMQLVSVERIFELSENTEFTGGLGYLVEKSSLGCPCDKESDVRFTGSLVYKF